MFDIGFAELMLIGIIGLVVIGPERLPRVARTVGHLLGRLQRYVGDVKSDIQREMQLEDLKKLQKEVSDSAREMENSIRQQASSVRQELDDAAAPLKDTVDEAAAEADALRAAGERIADSVAGAAAEAPPDNQLALGLDEARPAADKDAKP